MSKKTQLFIILMLTVLSSCDTQQGIQSKCQSTCKFDRACTSNCYGYQADVAAYAVNYAGCSCVLQPRVGQVQQWTNGACLSAQSKNNMDSKRYLIQHTEDNLLAFVAYDKARKLIVVSFRGSVCDNDGNKNIKVDRDFLFEEYVDSNGCPKSCQCKAHKGFNQGYNGLKAFNDRLLYNSIQIFMNQYGTNKILVTGISLGGALAALAAYDIKTFFKSKGKNLDMMVYTFGQPRIGNQALAVAINKEVTIYRVVHGADPVPHLPPRDLRKIFIHSQYYHPGIEVFYSSKNASPKICEGDGDKCSSSLDNLKNSFDACLHLQYGLIKFSGCGSTPSSCNCDFQMSNQVQTKEQLNSLSFICKFYQFSKNPASQPQLRQCLVDQMPPDLKCTGKTIDTPSFFNGLIPTFLSLTAGDHPIQTTLNNWINLDPIALYCKNKASAASAIPEENEL